MIPARLVTLALIASAPMLPGAAAPSPEWTEGDIRASRIQHVDPAGLADEPVFEADPLNLVLVIETGDQHVSVLDGDRLEVIQRVQSRAAVRGDPGFAAGGRHVYFASADGWVTKFDLWNLAVVAEVRAGIDTRNVAVSPDGEYVAVANFLPHTLTLFDGDLNLLKSIDVVSRDGRDSSRVSGVYAAGARSSFVAVLEDLPEVWEISFDPNAADIPLGFIHDHRLREGEFISGYLHPRRTLLRQPLDNFLFTPDHSLLIGVSRGGEGQVVSLDARMPIAGLPHDGGWRPGSSISFEWRGRQVAATANLRAGEVTVIDLEDFSVVERIPTRGPGVFLDSHEDSRYAFVDSMLSARYRNRLQVIDKVTLEIVGELEAPPGQTLAHVEFTRDGRYALASLQELDGAVIVYDAETLGEIKRLPMRRPAGKYNVWNNIGRTGTRRP